MSEILEAYELDSDHELITEIQPRGYNISSNIVNLKDVAKYPDKTIITVFGYIDSFEAVPMGKALKKIKCKVYKDGISANCSWITSNQKAKIFQYSLEKQSPKNTIIQVTGAIESFTTSEQFRIVTIANGKLNPISGDIPEDSNAVVVPEPLYRLTAGITPFKIRHEFRKLLKNFATIDKSKFLPLDLEKQFKLQPLEKSLNYVHGFIPIPVEKFEDFINYPGFTKRINVEKIWRIILTSYLATYEKGTPSIELLNSDKDHLSDLSKKLPFELTIDQKQTIWSMLKMFSEKTGSKSLVFGDVGSGKTLIALFISYILYLKGYQVAIITPTSILSRQHYEEALSLLGSKGIFLLHSKTKANEKKQISAFLEKGNPAIVIGTTSVNSLTFTKLKAVFIDEEQKLGVSSKEKLVKEFNSEPHLIYMTATPIPRTLASSIFTNFHVYQIRTKPKDRKERITSILNNIGDNKAEYSNIAKRMENKEQTLIIVPSISSNDLVNVSGAKDKYKKIFPKAKIEGIHGRMNKDDVDVIIERFMNGEFEILIATSMVDSGFSNPMISHVFVENADRFGIAQLHQIRGRCGRGKLQGYCYLIPSNYSKMKDLTRKRLEYVCSSEDGFKLSEFDIELRGSGDLAGEQQSGLELNFIDWYKEIDIMREYIIKNILEKRGI
jgi:ATP-dependent DNA helicase RecG